LRSFVLVDPPAFDADVVRERLEGLCRASVRADWVPVLSHERLSGNPHSGGYDRIAIADRLASVFPEARILIVIREQRSMIRSVYKQYLREGGASSLARYLAPPKQGIARIPMFAFEFFEYDRLIQHYLKLYGAGSVLVLPYEMLKADQAEFTSRILKFMGVEASGRIAGAAQNVGLSALSLSIKRWLNLFLIRDRLNPAGLIGDPRFNTCLEMMFRGLDFVLPEAIKIPWEKRLGRAVDRQVGNRYRQSNKRTAALVESELAELGYDC
jgi:hypothetical protein